MLLLSLLNRKLYEAGFRRDRAATECEEAAEDSIGISSSPLVDGADRSEHEGQGIGSSSSYYGTTGGSGMSLHSPGSISNDSKSLYDSGRTDSGFLSGANILSDQFLSEEISSPSYTSQRSRESNASGEIKSDSKSYMRLDSGVDVGLSEHLSGLSLKDANPTINNLNSNERTTGKSSSDTFISNIKLSSDDSASRTNRSSQQASEKTSNSSLSSLPWEIYFEQDEDGDTQLHIAILHSFIEVVYSLIRMVPHSSYLDIRNDASQTPLHLAVLTGQPRIVRHLLCGGASPDLLDKHGNTALHLAISLCDAECVRALTEPISVAETMAAELKYTPVMFNRQNRHDALYVNRYNYDGLACIHLAVMTGQVQLVQLLLWFGADVNARECKTGLTPLHIAVQMRNQEMAKFLLSNCRTLDLETPTYAGITPYQMAVAQQSTLALYLLENGADNYLLEDEDDELSDEESEAAAGLFGGGATFNHNMNGAAIATA